jgi:RNase P subunit RPR2
MRRIPSDGTTAIGDFRRYPGCRVQLSCGACGWDKAYDPERVIARLQQLRAGGHATRLADIVRRVAWTCPSCGRMRWRMAFAWPDGITEAEVKRLAARYRN